MTVSLFGIRHHGPGSARSLRQALEALRPDAILVEGPPDAEEVLPLLRHEEMEPPVALLGYVESDPRRASFYPFAVFSPEWQALDYGLSRKKVAVRFMDLPFSAHLALAEKGDDTEKGGEPPRDPLDLLAQAAGEPDGERWWERLVEERRDGDGIFAGIREAMTALRRDLPPHADPRRAEEEALREAHMRRTIREAAAKGFSRIAVVCGAWHVPALSEEALGAKAADEALLKGLPREKVQVTWVPWTNERLASESGYRAGIDSPGWYEHLWTHREGSSIRWLSRVARLLREEDLDASSAQVIDAVRLAEAVAAVRGRSAPGLAELTEASQAVYCFGSVVPLGLIRRKLIVGERLGKVPEEAPAVPLQRDLEREQKRLRMAPKASEEQVELDLRKEIDLDRSRLLHRLRLLSIPWGDLRGARSKGTFKEAWRTKWEAGFPVLVVDAARMGNTVAEACATSARRAADEAATLPALTELIARVLPCDLPEAAAHVMARLRDAAAVAGDVGHLMEALPPLADILRYGDVRSTDPAVVRAVVDGLVARVCVGLPPACSSLADDAAAEMTKRIQAVHASVEMLSIDVHRDPWREALRRIADADGVHGRVVARSLRLLFDCGAVGIDLVSTRLRLALSAANGPEAAAAWVQGFLEGSGAVLVHNEALWDLLDGWVGELASEAFVAALPVLRRTFSTFQRGELRQMGERVSRGAGPAPARSGGEGFDAARGEAVLPLLRLLLGIGGAR